MSELPVTRPASRPHATFDGVRSACTCVILLLAACFAPGQQPSETTGSVCGSVSDENGAPASHVRVVAAPDMSDYPGGGSFGLLGSDTDETGHYCVDHLGPGKYIMSAYDEKKGYPIRLMSGFYTWDSPAPKVTITAYNPDAHLDWRIPFKAGFLRLHVSVDRSDAKTIPVRFSLVVPSRPKVGLYSADWTLKTDQTDSFTVLLPPGEDVSLTATAPGYRRWPDNDRGELLNLRSGETKDITIPLTTITP